MKMNNVLGNRRVRLVLLCLGVLAGMIAWTVWSVASRSRVRPPDPARVRAWEKIAPRLQQAQTRDGEISAKYAQRISDFFAEKRLHCVAFAEDLTGWGGKWEFVKAKMASDNGKAYQAFLRQASQRHFFTDKDLKELMEGTITSYLSELEGEENALLVEIRTDLSEQDLPELRALAALQTEEAFRSEYRKMIDQAVPTVSRDLKITLGREAAVWVGSDVAAAVTVRIGSAVATRLGISGGILGTGAASGVATLGVGLVVGFIVDAAVDWLMRRAGYDPTGTIARQVEDSLIRIENLLLGGDPETHQVYQRLRLMQKNDRVG